LPCSDSRLDCSIRTLEEKRVDSFLDEHHFSDVDDCCCVSRLPLPRWCCPLSLAVERGDASLVVALLNCGADPLKPLELLGQRKGSTCGKQEARCFLEWAAAKKEETGQVPALVMPEAIIRRATCCEREAQLLREVQRGDPLLRNGA
jgi:hypothetical protein